MPLLKVNSKSLIVNRQSLSANRNRNKKFIHHSPFTIHVKEKLGFSLIELLVVVSLFGITASLITAAYLSFERSQRIKSAASALKSDLRLVQNQAYSGDKGAGGLCSATSSLGGWYLSLKQGDNTYTIGGDCITGTSESGFLVKTISLPRDIVVNKIFYDPNPSLSLPLAIFYRPLSGIVSFHNASYGVDFLQDDGVTLRNPLPQPPQSAVTIQLANSDKTRCYQVKIELTGEVNEIQPETCVY